jgi:hypothetical protein
LSLSGMTLIFLLVAGCGSTSLAPTTAPTSALSPTQAAGSGHIVGVVHLVSPPTPRMVVYAVDPATGIWASVETEPADGEAPFDLTVPPGSYQVIAAVADGDSVGLGYAPDGLTLAAIEIAPGQQITNIEVGPPGQSECGAMVGYPASPDGRFAAAAGPSADCLTDILTPTALPGSYVPITPEVCQTIQDLASQAVALSFSMEPADLFADPLTGEMGQGCTLTAMATGMQLADPGSVLSNLVNGMLGWTEELSYQANGPTGAATAMKRDMALMLINVEWMPDPDANCPADQPIGSCDLKPEQRLYTIQIRAAMK